MQQWIIRVLRICSCCSLGLKLWQSDTCFASLCRPRYTPIASITGVATIMVNWRLVRAQCRVCLPAPALVLSVARTTSFRISLGIPFSRFFSTNLEAITPVTAWALPHFISTTGPLSNPGITLRKETFSLLASKEVNSGASSPVGVAQTTSLWPTPPSTQMFVAFARCGKRHVHDVTRGATPIRAVVSDLDGTLLAPDKRVSARTLEAVRKIRCGVAIIAY